MECSPYFRSVFSKATRKETQFSETLPVARLQGREYVVLASIVCGVGRVHDDEREVASLPKIGAPCEIPPPNFGVEYNKVLYELD
jgi:hypothetical protein